MFGALDALIASLPLKACMFSENIEVSSQRWLSDSSLDS